MKIPSIISPFSLQIFESNTDDQTISPLMALCTTWWEASSVYIHHILVIHMREKLFRHSEKVHFLVTWLVLPETDTQTEIGNPELSDLLGSGFP